MDFLPQNIDDYAVAHSQPEPEILKQLSRQTHLEVLQPRMCSGHYQGRVLSMLSKLVNPKAILEIGTFTGYSALCMCEGLQADGVLHTIEVNEELSEFQKKYFKAYGYEHQIQAHVGNALDIIPTLQETFDLVFIDADKVNYSNYFDLMIPKMKKGGIILSDNVLWSGKVTKVPDEKDLSTKALQVYNQKINTDPRVESVLLPIRDGLTVTRVL